MSTDRPGVVTALHGLVSRQGIIVAIALLLMTGLAWYWLLTAPMPGHEEHTMAGMAIPMATPVEPWSAGYLIPAFTMWAIMMVAMMTPSAAPMILLHARLDRAEGKWARPFHSLVFILAYLLVWSAFSALAALSQAALISSGVISAVALAVSDRILAAGLLFLAGLYELTAAKRLCLENCQSPLLFIHRYWRPDGAGALRLGTIHGLYCVGCCWALMLLLFVGGVMNLAAIAVLTLIVMAEKFAPPGWRTHLWLSILLILAGVWLALSPFQPDPSAN